MKTSLNKKLNMLSYQQQTSKILLKSTLDLFDNAKKFLS